MRSRAFGLRRIGVVAVASLVVPVLYGCGDADDAASRATSVTSDAPLSTTSVSESPTTTEPEPSTTTAPASSAPAGTVSATTDTSPAASGGASPVPDEMCGNGQVPQAVAYDLVDGGFRWVSCTDESASRSLQTVTDDAVYLYSNTGPVSGETIALDPADGTVLSATALPPSVYSEPEPIEVDELTVAGAQEGPITVYGPDGAELWSQPGRWVYDDVGVIADGAVFAVEDQVRLVAYDLTTGDTRWEYVGDLDSDGFWPWHAEDGRLFTMWTNLQVRDTATGDLMWTTNYPPPANPLWRLAGVDLHNEVVYVGVGTAASGGD